MAMTGKTKNTTLELFSGTQSWTKVAREMLRDTHQSFLTLDNDLSFKDSTTFCQDILAFSYKDMITPSNFHVTHIWASIPCTEYSMAKRNGPPRKLDYADSLCQKALEIIQYYQLHNPKLIWYIENPSHSLLKSRPCMQHLQDTYFDVTYCQYEPAWQIRKATRIWSNISPAKFHPKTCPGARLCQAAIPSPRVAGRFIHANTPKGKFWNPEWKTIADKKRELGKVPFALCRDLIAASM